MAKDVKPDTWIVGMDASGGEVKIPVASIPELDEEEAKGLTGDIRKFLFALLEKIYGEYNSLDYADKPQKMRVARGTYVNDATGKAQKSYTLTFDVEFGEQEVEGED